MGPQARKRSRGVKVTRKQRKHVNVRIKNKLQNADVRNLFDKNKSPVDNLRELGLEVDVNKEVIRRSSQRSNTKIETKSCAAFVGTAAINQLTQMTGPFYTEKNPTRRKISRFDQEYIHKMITKHGSDYKAMERDITTNFYQHTATKMKTLCEKFMSLAPEELLVAPIKQ